MKILNIAVIGASGGIGSALIKTLSKSKPNRVFAFSRSIIDEKLDDVVYEHIDISCEASIERAVRTSLKEISLDLILLCSGTLHNEFGMPEKSIHQLNQAQMENTFLINTIGPSLVAKHFLPKLNSERPCVFAALSARVGSISDNKLGGWYSYRASKAALNMIIKSLSIELARKNQHAIVVGLHPGTVDTTLSSPFQKSVKNKSLFSTERAAAQLLSVVDMLEVNDSGRIFAWDGSEIFP